MMRRVKSLEAFLQSVEDRKRALGITDEMIAAARNDGTRRTPEKREMLGRIQQRAKAAGIEPLAAKF
jgi:uncharacterized membrane protein YebE (DUF533 family)